MTSESDQDLLARPDAKPLGLSSTTPRAAWSPQPHRSAQTTPPGFFRKVPPASLRRRWLAFCCKQDTTPDDQPRLIPPSGVATQPPSPNAAGYRIRPGAKPQPTPKAVCVHAV